jgi:hypothetical protein
MNTTFSTHAQRQLLYAHCGAQGIFHTRPVNLRRLSKNAQKMICVQCQVRKVSKKLFEIMCKTKQPSCR